MSQEAKEVVMNGDVEQTQKESEKSTKFELSLLQTCEAHNDKVWCLAWHYSEELIVTGSSDKTIKLWGKHTGDENNFECKATLEGGHTRTIRSLAWKPNMPSGELVFASSSFDATSVIW